ncbi:hypothetical protein SPHINGOR109_11149 [Sphingorhabdus sp. 109]|nr:hypothetical protein SPHINGOR109_11149 [Sphingorhabdus sp. 109]
MFPLAPASNRSLDPVCPFHLPDVMDRFIEVGGQTLQIWRGMRDAEGTTTVWTRYAISRKRTAFMGSWGGRDWVESRN